MIKENLQKLTSEIPDYVKLVAVSKTKPVGDILEVYHEGHKVFGENKVQELIDKQPHLPTDINWHFIGHLQRNKVKFLVPFISMIESVDSQRLLKQINKEALKQDRIINCLLQFHIAEETSKFGFHFSEVKDFFSSETFKNMKNVKIKGVMGMATFTDDEEKVRSEFKQLKRYFDELKKKYFSDDDEFNEVSMGMTNDYKIAIEEGSTIVRIGSAIFGPRSCQL